MAAAAHPTVKIAGKQIDLEDLNQVIIDQDVNQPDMCQIGLKNVGAPPFSSSIKLGDAIEVKISFGETPEVIFEGEVVCVEPTYEMKGKSGVMIRGFNRLHRLTRGRKSRTFENATDEKIVKEICTSAQLTPDISIKNPITYPHIYQHNQTDYEFLLQRASRINCELMGTGEKKLVFRDRNVSNDSGITVKLGKPDEDFALQRYTARLTNAGQIASVEVRGWDPKTRKEIVGTAENAAAKMGKEPGNKDATSIFGSVVQFEVDDKVTTKEEADARAKTILEEQLMNYITGEGIVMGHPKLKAGIVVNIDLGPDDRFSGKHYISAVSHRYTMKEGAGKGGGYTTAIRFKRNSGGKT